MRKSAPFQIAGNLSYTPTDNGFKEVQNAYLAVISNLDELVQPCYSTNILSKLSLCVNKHIDGMLGRPWRRSLLGSQCPVSVAVFEQV